MASLKNIKLKIQSIKKTSTVTRAMEAVSAVKMRKAQERALSGRTYATVALTILESLARTVDAKGHPLMQERAGKTCFIVITSDKGLAGSLNSAVIRITEAEIAARNLSPSDTIIVGIGKRGADHFTNRGYEVREKYFNVSDDVSEDSIRAVTDKVLEWHTTGEIGTCLLAFQNFISVLQQEPAVRQIVPITIAAMSKMVAGIRPAKGKYAVIADTTRVAPTVYTIEPDPDEVLAILLPKLLNIAVFQRMLEAKASEHSARMVAMKNATDNANERGKEYTRHYNKVRQASITREISEITSGIEAMR